MSPSISMQLLGTHAVLFCFLASVSNSHAPTCSTVVVAALISALHTHIPSEREHKKQAYCLKIEMHILFAAQTY